VNEKVEELMETVGLSRRFIKRYPHEFSGGQRQRIGIARSSGGRSGIHRRRRTDLGARRFDPGADHESDGASAGRRKDLTYLFISHDLRAVRHLSDRVAVMYLGKIVELRNGKEIYAEPLMPYSKALISPFRFRIPISKRHAKRSF
jgi:oligopeptide transport system ATP-binding protein